MANNTTEYWSIDGTSLHQYGWSIATVGGTRYGLPARRGNNLTLPYRPGSVFVTKQAAERPMNLIMWLTGTEPGTGDNPAHGDQRLQWNDSWDFLRRLVWKVSGRQFSLTRRWWLTNDEGTPQLVTATALAELAGTMEPTMTGRTRADFVMELLLADPYFYGSTVTSTVNYGADESVVNPGHDVALNPYTEVDLIGPLTNARLTNLTADPDVWVQVSTVASGDTVRLNIGNFTATRVTTGGNVIDRVTNGGSRHWFGLLPGANLLRLTRTAGSGHVVVRHRPPYV